MSELLFDVSLDPGGGYVAACSSEAVFTQAATWEELAENVREAVDAHFAGRGSGPRRIRLRLVREEVLERQASEPEGAATLADLELAIDFVSSGLGVGLEQQAYVSRTTGRVVFTSDDDDLEELPDDIDDPDRWVPVPTEQDLDLKRVLVRRYVDLRLPEHRDTVEGFFRRRGAYGRYKGLLADLELLDDWYQFESAERLRAIRDWCFANDLKLQE